MAKINEIRTKWWTFSIKNPVHRKKHQNVVDYFIFFHFRWTKKILKRVNFQDFSSYFTMYQVERRGVEPLTSRLPV